MKKNLKETILNSAVNSFMENGYEKTTMRQIAKDLDLAVGNVNYYYPKKEDIVRDYHNAVMDAFLSVVIKESQNEDPWITYFMAEYSFMYFIAHDEPTRKLYESFTKEQNLRDFYVERHQEVFLTIFKENLPSKIEDIYLSTLAMCSLEFDLVTKYTQYQDVWDFDDLLQHIFETRLSFLHLRISTFKEILKVSIERGKTLTYLHEQIKEQLKRKD